MTMLLDVSNLSVAYGGHEALNGVALQVDAGEAVVVLGANGAGKSTLLQAIAGIVAPRTGARISFGGTPIERAPSHRIVERGIALVPEGRRLLGDMTVYENLTLGAFVRRARRDTAASIARVYATFPRLAERRRQLVRTLSGGEQQMLAVGRALMSRPVLLMLDEPSLGLSPLLCRELYDRLAEIKSSDVSILLVEQNAQYGLALADRGYLLSTGRIVKAGDADALKADELVAQSYLGVTPSKDVAPDGGASEAALRSR